jgi:phosphoglycerate dehydrogenase-like enzyme
MQIFCNVESGQPGRQRLAAEVAPDVLYFADPDELTAADVAALLESQVAFGTVPPGLLTQAASLRWLQLDSVGCDQYLHLDWPVLGPRLTVTNLRGFFAIPVAETGIAGLLALTRAIDHLALLQRERTWRPPELRARLRTLAGARVVVAGFGAIGHAVAERLAAFGCVLQTFGTHASGAGLVTVAELDRALPHADVVVLALPETASTAGLFCGSRLSLMKADAILVNLGRGGLVEEQPLVALLEQNRLGGAVLDVTQAEPLPAASPLWTAPRVLLTQHTAGGSEAELAGKASVFLANLERYRAGRPLASVVDWSKGY